MNDFSPSVIIPVHNGERTIGRAIEAVLRQRDVGPVEVIVVDDGSTDKTEEIVAAYSSVKYIRQKNAGPATARNRGAREARGDLLCFTDADCVPHDDWLARMIKHCHDPSVAAVAGSYGIANPDNVLAACVHQEIRYRHDQRMGAYIRAFGSYNVGIKRKVFDELGGFNAAYRQASGEDNELSYRIIAAGYKIYFARESLVDHYHPTRLIAYLRDQSRHGYWRARMYVGHPAMSKGDDYTFWKDIIEVALAAALLLAFGLGLADVEGGKPLGSIVLIIFLIIEIYFCYLYKIKFPQTPYFAVVMVLRSLTRTFGLFGGSLSLLPAVFRSVFNR